MKFVQVTDLHLTAPAHEGSGAIVSRAVSDAFDHIARHHGDADFCVMTGDLADSGAPEAYRWLKDRLSTFPLRTFVLLGNHDDRGAFLDAFRGDGHDDGGFVQRVYETADAVFLFLDTLLPGSGAGTLCAARLAWLRAQISRADRRAVYIFMHHPPMDIGDPDLDPIRLNNPREFAAAIGPPERISHIFFGHIHRNLFAQWNGVSCTALAPLHPDAGSEPADRQDGVPGAGTAYGVATIGQGQLTLTFTSAEA